LSALERDEGNVEILASLAELQRRSRKRPLISTLLRLSEATGGDLDLHKEAAELAMDELADEKLATSIAGKLLDLATARWMGDASTDSARQRAALTDAGVTPTEPSEAASWALEVLVRLQRSLRPDDDGAVIALYRMGARLPFGPGQRRAYRLRAAELADAE